MTFWMVFSQHLPTLLLISMGASEGQLGLQQAFAPGLQLLQLPVLRAIARVSKRSILVWGHAFAVLGAIPILFVQSFSGAGHESNLAIYAVISCFGLVAAGVNVSNTVWFPMLRSYVEANRIGHFFGLLRSGWHFSLILYYVGAQWWLAAHPGNFGLLFAAAWCLGLLRIALIARMPERSERTGEAIRVREAFALVRDSHPLRRYLIGVASSGAVRVCATTFVIVMMRREVGFSEGDVVLSTIAFFAGGLASLYAWGRIIDRVGAAPVFRATSLGLASLLLLVPLIDDTGSADLALALFFFFAHAVLTAGFGVADTHVLFRLAPPEAPARILVIASVLTHAAIAIAPVLVGALLEHLLAGSANPLGIYRGLFVALALVQVAVFLPLREFRR
jgi:predicted MFS family arabinose efflux permease